MRYHGDGLYQCDTWCHVTPDGLVHAFYLQQARPEGVRTPLEADSLGHAVSRDLIDWVRVVGNGEFTEVFLDDELVLQCVWYGPRSGDVGFLVDRARATFADFELLAHP